MKRGDVILVRFPHPTGLRGKKRPAVIVQSDAYAGTVSTGKEKGSGYVFHGGARATPRVKT